MPQRWICAFITSAQLLPIHCAFCCFNNNQLLLLKTTAVKYWPRSLLSRNSAARRSTWMLQTLPSILVFFISNKKQPRVNNVLQRKRHPKVEETMYVLRPQSTGLERRALPSSPKQARRFDTDTNTSGCQLYQKLHLEVFFVCFSLFRFAKYTY